MEGMEQRDEVLTRNHPRRHADEDGRWFRWLRARAESICIHSVWDDRCLPGPKERPNPVLNFIPVLRGEIDAVICENVVCAGEYPVLSRFERVGVMFDGDDAAVSMAQPMPKKRRQGLGHVGIDHVGLESFQEVENVEQGRQIIPAAFLDKVVVHTEIPASEHDFFRELVGAIE